MRYLPQPIYIKVSFIMSRSKTGWNKIAGIEINISDVIISPPLTIWARKNLNSHEFVIAWQLERSSTKPLK